MNYGEILSKAGKIIWKHKVMWIFGFLASCAGGGGGGGGSGSGSSFRADSQEFPSIEGAPPWLDNLLLTLDKMAQDGTLYIYIAAAVVALVCLGLILTVLALVLSTIGRIGLVRGAWLVDEGAEKLTFGELWRQSLPYFWRVLLLTILLWVIGLVVGLLLILPVIAFTVLTLGFGLICLIPLFIAVGWLVSVWVEQTTVAIVGEDLSLFDGMKRAWEVIRNNFSAYVIMALILFIGAAVVVFLIGLPAVLIVAPVVIGLLAESGRYLTTGLIVAAVLFVLYLPIAILLNSVLHAYLGSAWTLVFRRLSGREQVEPKPAQLEA